MNYGQVLPQARDAITATTTTDRELLAAQAGKRYRVPYIYISASAATAVTFESSTTNLRFRMFAPDNGGVTAIAPDGQFLFETASGESLTWTSDTTASVFVSILYETR